MPRALACGLCIAGLIGIGASLARGQEPGVRLQPDEERGRRPGEPDPPVPVHREPHHRQVFQYGPMRILELQLPPGDISWFHSHEWPVLYVTLSQGQMRTQVLGEEWSGGGRARGPAAGRAAARPSTAPRATSTTGYAERPVTHRIENTGAVLVRAMVVVNETQGDETATEAAAGFAATAELTNRWFRAYRIALAPGATTPAHQHRAPVAIIQATSGTGRGVGGMTFEFNEPGQWAYFDSGDRHEVRNTGEGPVEFIEVEVRRK